MGCLVIEAEWPLGEEVVLWTFVLKYNCRNRKNIMMDEKRKVRVR